MAPLLQEIIANAFDPESESFFTETKKIACMHAILTIFSWRLYPVIGKTIKTYLSVLSNPYQQIREALGRCMSEMIQVQWYCSASSVSELLTHYQKMEPQQNQDTIDVLHSAADHISNTRSMALQSPDSKATYLNSCKTGTFCIS